MAQRGNKVNQLSIPHDPLPYPNISFLDNFTQLERSPGYGAREERDHWEEGAEASLGHTFCKHGLGQDTLVPRKLLSRFVSQLGFSKGSRLGRKGYVWRGGFWGWAEGS